ncbi:hypothetical protein PR048_019897 [Dryococelus australis]|uniref:Uncharacterized protein n=1 Tax=Dryococelus australis TaxID=614101 RepID=A0ABQ9H4R0_9NEOP|nr:hypothetical protein PR048_019897 [Dryococelus australis]
MWLKCNPAKVVTYFQVSLIFGAAHVLAATMKHAIEGFKKTGSRFPDPNMFSEADFLPSALFDIQLVVSEYLTTNSISAPPEYPTTVTKYRAKKTKTNEDLSNESQPGYEKKYIKKALNKNVKRKNKITEDTDTDEIEEDAEYFYCGNFYFALDEGWVSYQSCLKWTHNCCSDIDSVDDKAVFVC